MQPYAPFHTKTYKISIRNVLFLNACSKVPPYKSSAQERLKMLPISLIRLLKIPCPLVAQYAQCEGFPMTTRPDRLFHLL